MRATWLLCLASAGCGLYMGHPTDSTSGTTAADSAATGDTAAPEPNSAPSMEILDPNLGWDSDGIPIYFDQPVAFLGCVFDPDQAGDTLVAEWTWSYADLPDSGGGSVRTSAGPTTSGASDRCAEGWTAVSTSWTPNEENHFDIWLAVTDDQGASAEGSAWLNDVNQ